jgi:hypothetical protein
MAERILTFLFGQIPYFHQAQVVHHYHALKVLTGQEEETDPP